MAVVAIFDGRLLVGEELKIDDKVYLAPTRPHFGGLRWWFVCPQLNRRVRKLYLPVGGRHFWSRHAYEPAYASQRETKCSKNRLLPKNSPKKPMRHLVIN